MCVNAFRAFECGMDMALRRGPRLKVVKMKKRPELVLSVVNSAACLLKSYSHLKKKLVVLLRIHYGIESEQLIRK